jgi:DNA-binding transcriptional LysR family regulator
VRIIVRRDVEALEVRLLQTFDALMIEHSVTRAAARLGMTQQGLSGQLSRLRDLFEDPLFVRAGAGVVPTPRAESLYPLVQGALEKLRALLVPPTFDPARFVGVISLATTDYALVLLLPKLLRRLRTEAPHLRLAVRPVSSASLELEMRNRKIDLALTIPQFVPAGLHSRRLFRERYVGVVRQKHPLAKGNVDVQRFVAFPHLLVSPDKGDFNGPTDAALDKIGLKRNIALVVPSFSVVAAIIDTTDLVAVLPSRLLDQTRRKLHAFEPPVAVEGFDLHAYWPERLNIDAMHKWFRRLILESLSAAD